MRIIPLLVLLATDRSANLSATASGFVDRLELEVDGFSGGGMGGGGPGGGSSPSFEGWW